MSRPLPGDDEALIAGIVGLLETARDRLRSGATSVTAQAMILATWTEGHPVESAIAMVRFLNGQEQMRPRLVDWKPGDPPREWKHGFVAAGAGPADVCNVEIDVQTGERCRRGPSDQIHQVEPA